MASVGAVIWHYRSFLESSDLLFTDLFFDISRSLDDQLPNLLPVSESLCIMNSDIEARKAIVQRAIDRANSRGVPIDEDPTIVALLDAWVRGEIDARTMRLRYLEPFKLRASIRPS